MEKDNIGIKICLRALFSFNMPAAVTGCHTNKIKSSKTGSV